MSRLPLWVACAVSVLVGAAGAARAQPPVPGGPGATRPAFSPYLNLARPGTAPALNYYGLVRPEVQFRQNIQNLQGAVTANQQAIGGVQADVTGVSVTGHPTQFLNYGGYFLSNNNPTLYSRPTVLQTTARQTMPVLPMLPRAGIGGLGVPRQGK
jgi:hypothetical protein